ncbi:MAG: hypothetical protein FWD64_04405 [Acidobacteriaceae bacterium]|nr:hypothetical protein [Acidobacteriaceae bacterium]
MEFGGGTLIGKFTAGGIVRHPVGSTVYSLGDSLLNFRLPTDLFMGGRSVYMTGFGIDTQLRDERTDLHFYGGGISNFSQSQFFTGAVPQQMAAMLTFHGITGENRNWKYTTHLLLANRSTFVEGVQWKYHGNNSRNYATLSAVGGLGEMRHPYGALSADLRRRTLNVRGEYVWYGKQNTPLLNLPTLQYGEPVKENIYANYRPFRFLMLMGSRRNLLVFPSMTVNPEQTGYINTTNMGGITFLLLKANLSISYFDSRYKGMKSYGESASVGRQVTRYVSMGGSYSIDHSSTGSKQEIGTAYVLERITPQLHLRQTYVHTGFNSYMTYGGDYFNNRFSAGVYYNTTYIPTNIGRPYQPNYSFSGSARITRRISVNASKSIDPYGKGYYMASANYSSYSTDWAGAPPPIRIDDFSVRGHVVTPDSRPVAGLAILIDKALLITDMSGYFELREHKQRTHNISIDNSQSGTMSNYEIISAPSHVESVYGDDPGITIVVKRTNARGASQLFIEHQQVTGQAQNSRPSPAPAATPSTSSRVPTPAAVTVPVATYEPYKPYQPNQPASTVNAAPPAAPSATPAVSSTPAPTASVVNPATPPKGL